MNVAEAVIAADFLRERLIVLERIARLGVYCIDVPVEEFLRLYEPLSYDQAEGIAMTLSSFQTLKTAREPSSGKSSPCAVPNARGGSAPGVN